MISVDEVDVLECEVLILGAETEWGFPYLEEIC